MLNQGDAAMMPDHRPAPGLFLLLVPMVLLARAPSAQAAEPAVAIRHFAVREAWRVPAEDEDYLVSTVTDAAIDPRGNLCLADVKQKCVFVFSRDGRFLRTLGREGEGPGESTDVRRVFFDGDRYGLLQAAPGAIVWLEADGTPAGKVIIAPGATEGESLVSVGWGQQDGRRILAWINRSTITGGQYVRGEEGIVEVARDGSAGPLVFRIPVQEGTRIDDGIDEGRGYDIWMNRWCGDGQGGAWVAPERDRYLLQHWGAGGRLLQEVALPYEPVERSALARQRVLEWMIQRGWREEQVRVGRTAPVFASLRLGAGGRLWARLDLGGNAPGGDVGRVYDVFDRQGRRVEQVRVHGAVGITPRVVLNDTTMVALVDDADGDGQWLVFEELVPFVAGAGNEPVGRGRTVQ